jgi:hypothetical protein
VPARGSDGAIGLALGDGAIPGQSLGSLGPMRIPLQKGASQVEAFGFLDVAGARYLTYKYVYLCHPSSTSLVLIITPAVPHGAFKLKVTFCVTAVFTPVLAKHSKSFSLIDCISVGVDRMQPNFKPMRRQVEAWQSGELTDVTARVVIYGAFVEGKLEAPKHLARSAHDSYFAPKYEEFRPRTIWSLSNAFTSAFKELDPIPQFKATAKLGEFLEARFSQSF